MPGTATPEEREALRLEARHELWRRGHLRHLLHSSQREVYDAIAACEDHRFVLEISRQWGKTWLLAALACETAQGQPGCRVVYGAPTLKHLQEFIIPTFSALANHAPADARPMFRESKGRWEFPNGSYVHLFGADDKASADRGRGPKAARVIFDECGFTPVLGYVLDDIFKAQTLHSGGMTLLGSTPAELPDHPFTEIATIAETNGNYARRTIYDNPLLTPERIQGFIEQGAKDKGLTPDEYVQTDTFRREYLAERVINKLLVVLPEWDKHRDRLLVAVERPARFLGQVTLDFGGNDPHAAHFGYWHFERAAFVVEDELLLRNGENTAKLAEAIQAKERELWGVNRWDGTLRGARDEPTQALIDCLPGWLQDVVNKAETTEQPHTRWCDNNIQLARDLYELHRMAFIPTAKDNLEMQVNNLRVAIESGQYLVHPRCVHTDRHFRGTTWKDFKRKDFARRAGEHGDLLAAAIYELRNVDKRNPAPKLAEHDALGRPIGPKQAPVLPATRLSRRLGKTG